MAKKLDNGLESGTVEHGLLRLEGTPTYDAQSFEIAAITVGEGNGWHFDELVLKDALPLFDRAQCFIDHVAEQSDGQHHSVRDLAGVLTEPQWDDSIRGIRCRLQPLGPAAEILKETGRQMLSEHGSAARVGFSADLSFTRRGKHVDRILKIHSVDLVVDPARGGAFLRALASQKLQTSVAGEAEPLRARFQNAGDGGKADESVIPDCTVICWTARSAHPICRWRCKNSCACASAVLPLIRRYCAMKSPYSNRL